MPKPTAWFVSHRAMASSTVSRRGTDAAAITANAANGVTHVNTMVIAALMTTSNPSHTGRNHFLSDISGSPREFFTPRLPAPALVDNGVLNRDNTPAHEHRDP